jgi:dihydrofolate synthase / folylpolyglutamate synthase
VLNYPESVAYLYSLGNEIKTAKLGLERVGIVWEAMGLPTSQPPVVHVAGTNGKGSTCALIEAALRAQGRKTGLYTSPHLVQPTERIQINGMPISDAEFAAAFAVVHHVSEELLEQGRIDAHPTYFETVTLMAFEVFRAQAVDWAVIEVGLGGRLDATNLVQPELCVITPVDFDHEAWLGKSSEAIAFEKAGILKPGVPAVIAQQRAQATAVIGARGMEVDAPLYRSAEVSLEVVSADAYGSDLLLAGQPVHCPLAGEHQWENARTAARALQLLEVPFAGMATAVWPGRLECVSRQPEIILDGAHNPAGARALARYIERFHKGRRVGMIFGTMRDKAFEEVTSILFPLVDDLICTAPDQSRALRPEAILELADHAAARSAPDLAAALALPRECDVLFITGSLYLVGEARALLVQ